MSRQRVSYWKASGDGADTVPQLSAAIAPACPQLFMSNNIYPSEDMKTGIEVSLLVSWSLTLLAHLLRLDPRGGFFTQSDANDAVSSQAELPENKVHVEKAALERKLSVPGFSPICRSFVEDILFNR